MSIRCIIDDTEYPSMAAAQRALGLSYYKVRRILEFGEMYGHTGTTVMD